MPGVEPGSETDSLKRTTCVFDLQGLVAEVTDRQVLHYQSQKGLAVGPETQPSASSSSFVTESWEDEHSHGQWHGFT